MSEPDAELRARIIQIERDKPELSIREIARHAGANVDVVKDVLVDHMVQTGASRLPHVRMVLDRMAARL